MVSLLPMLWPHAPQNAWGSLRKGRHRARGVVRPHWWLATISLATSFFLVGAVSPPTETSIVAPPSSESAFTRAVTEYRGAALVVDSDLSHVAQRWAESMASIGLVHSNLSPLLDRWDVVGENVGMGNSVEEIMEALIASPSHRANMDDPRFTHMGIGVFVDAQGVIWTTHLFAGGESASFRMPAGGP